MTWVSPMDVARQLIAAMHRDPEVAAEVRRAVLTDELLELPARVSELVEAQSRTERELQRLAATQATVLQWQERADVQFADLKGGALETRLHLDPRWYVPRRLATGARLVEGDRLDQLLAGLEGDEAADVERADAFVMASSAEGEAVLFVVEAAWRAHVDDLERAERRARVLRQTFQAVRALVVSQVDPGESLVHAAQVRGVALVTEVGGLLTSGEPPAA